jgi:predicted extracellular nuclease
MAITLRTTLPTLAAALAAALAATTLGLAPPAAASSTGLVVSEVYGGGGNTGAPYRNDFVELQNTSASPIPLDGLSVQYRSASGTGTGVTPLDGVLPAGAHWLVAEAAGASTTAPLLPTPDETGDLSLAASSGIVFVAGTTDPVAPGDASVVDLVGYGSAATVFEGSGPTATLTNTTSAGRSPAGLDTDDNAADLTAGAPSPEGSGGTPPAEPPTSQTIEAIQGEGATSPFAGRDVVTSGVVTA